MTARPFMPLFVGDYIGDTQHLSRSEHGGYMLLIMAYWAKGGPLPDDDKVLRRITLSSTPYEWKKLRKNLQNFFTVRDGLWHHKRIDFELKNIKQKKALADRAEAPRAGARAHGSILPFGKEIDGIATNAADRSPPAAGELTVAGQEAPLDNALGGLEGRAPTGKEKTQKKEIALVEEGAAIIGQPNLVRKMLRIVGYDRVAEALAKVFQRLAHLRSPAGYFLAICTGRGGQGPAYSRPPALTAKQEAAEKEAALQVALAQMGAELAALGLRAA